MYRSPVIEQKVLPSISCKRKFRAITILNPTKAGSYTILRHLATNTLRPSVVEPFKLKMDISLPGRLGLIK